VTALGVVAPMPARTVRRAVRTVLARERVPDARISVTQLSTQRMRALNRRALGRDRATDVIAFGMAHDGTVVGDVYVCPPVARRFATRHGIPPREELVRIVVHGTLHALGYRHPEGPERERSPMWRRQERYVHATVKAGAP
jgi:probable rRNA maturation factor